MKQLLRRLEEQLILRNFSLSTRKSYLSAVRRFYLWCEARSKEEGFEKSKAVRQYLVHRFEIGKSWQTVNGDYSALKILYEQVLGRAWKEQGVPRPRNQPVWLTAMLTIEANIKDYLNILRKLRTFINIVVWVSNAVLPC